MSGNGMDAVRQQVAQACMQMRDVLTPILEAAEGVKADMVARGWSPQNAELVAAGFAQTVLRGVSGGGS